jgi:hypothetical protein
MSNKPPPQLGKGHVTKDREYKAGGLPKTDLYVLDKERKTEQKVSTPSQTKEENEPGKSS